MRSIRIEVVKAIMVVSLTAMLAGCASQGNLVRCDGRLEPINTPAPELARTHERSAGRELAGSEAERE